MNGVFDEDIFKSAFVVNGDKAMEVMKPTELKLLVLA